jgi:hypothetical protein
MDLEQAAKEAGGIPAGNSMEKDHYAFEVTYRGQTHVVTNKILTEDEKDEAARIAARMRDGMAYDTFEPFRATMQDMKAWLVKSLVDPPQFLTSAGIGKLMGDGVMMLTKLWGVVQEHERIFRGSGED